MLDTYNGNPAQAESYRLITGITAPILRQAARGLDYAGAILEDVVVVDQERVVRLSVTGSSEDMLPLVNDMVASLLMQTPLITLSVRQLHFGTKLEVGSAKAVQLTIDNTGSGDLEITGLQSSISGITMNPDKFTARANDKTTVEITLMPDMPGTLAGTVTLRHNESSVGSLTIPISELMVEGQTPPTIALVQESFVFPNTEVGHTQNLTFTVKNDGPGVLTVSAIKSSLPDFTIDDWNFTLEAGVSKDVTITFQPQTEGDISGLLNVRSDDPNRPLLSFPISGMAVITPADPRTDFDGNGRVEFPDFLVFVQAFGQVQPAFDLDGSGSVDFGDFLLFVQSFGKTVDQ